MQCVGRRLVDDLATMIDDIPNFKLQEGIRWARQQVGSYEDEGYMSVSWGSSGILSDASP